jgi:hypothetical protein
VTPPLHLINVVALLIYVVILYRRTRVGPR